MNFLFEVIFSPAVFDLYIDYPLIFKIVLIAVSCIVGTIAFLLLSLIIQKIFKTDWIETLKKALKEDKIGQISILFIIFNTLIFTLTISIINSQLINGVAYYVNHNGKYSTLIKQKCVPEYMKQNKVSFSTYMDMCIHNQFEEENDMVDEQQIKKEKEIVGKVFKNSTQKQ